MTRSTWLLVAITALALIGASWAASGWKEARSHSASAVPETRTAVAVPAGPRIAAMFVPLRSRAAALVATLPTTLAALPATLRGSRAAALLWIPPAGLALALVLRRRSRRAGWAQRKRRVLKLARSGRDVAVIAREAGLSQDLVRAVLRPRFERRTLAGPGKGLPDRKLRPAGRGR